jgi:hypothetical protein
MLVLAGFHLAGEQPIGVRRSLGRSRCVWCNGWHDAGHGRVHEGVWPCGETDGPSASIARTHTRCLLRHMGSISHAFLVLLPRNTHFLATTICSVDRTKSTKVRQRQPNLWSYHNISLLARGAATLYISLDSARPDFLRNQVGRCSSLAEHHNGKGEVWSASKSTRFTCAFLNLKYL